jgi:tetratricopeptide (TPR) repeat protein
MKWMVEKAMWRAAILVVLGVCVFAAGGQAMAQAAGSGAAGATPWYRDMATVIAFAALAFSFGTTVVSSYRAKQQDIQSSRQELRGILQRLSAIPRELMRESQRYAGDPGLVESMGQNYNEEGTLLTRQAAEIVRRLPYRIVSAIECYAIAVAMQSSYNLGEAKEFLDMALAKVNNFNDEIGAVRLSAYLEFLMAQTGNGRLKYQEALNIFTKYPNYDPFTVASTNIMTELNWGGSEAMVGEFELAKQHADNAERIVETLPASMGSDNLKAQIEQTRQQIMRGIAGMPTKPAGAPAQGFIQN